MNNQKMNAKIAELFGQPGSAPDYFSDRHALALVERSLDDLWTGYTLENYGGIYGNFLAQIVLPEMRTSLTPDDWDLWDLKEQEIYLIATASPEQRIKALCRMIDVTARQEVRRTGRVT